MRLGRPSTPRVRWPALYNYSERWRFRNRRPTNHPIGSFQTRLFGTRSQRWFYADGVLSSISDVALVQFAALYAIRLGASDAEVGLLAIATGLAGFLSLAPGARIAEITASRKWVVLIAGGGVGRIAILLAALIPVFTREPRTAVYLFVGITFLRSFVGNLGHGSWMSLLADIIPIDLRRFYITQRMLAITVAAAITTPLVGFALRLIGDVEGFQVVLVGAFLFGAASTYCYFHIEEPPRHSVAGHPRGSTADLFRDRGFVRYLISLFVLNTTTMIVGPFFIAYFVREIGGTAAQLGVLAATEQVCAVAAQFGLGLLVTRVASERLFRATMWLPALIPALWLLVQSPWDAAMPFAAGGFVWAIYNVGIFNLLMEYAPSNNVARYAAVQQIVILAAQFIGPVIGTVVVARWGIQTAIYISIAGRLVAAGLASVPLRWVPAFSLPVPVPPPPPGTITVPHGLPNLGDDAVGGEEPA